MKCPLQVAAIGMLAIALSAADEKAPKTTPKHKLAADFDACPDGHNALKDVPIVWGHFELFTKNPKDYTEHERMLAARRDRGEIVFGGDILPPNRPKFRVVCARCGFSFHPSDMTPEERKMLKVPRDWDSYWRRDSKNAGGFQIPFTKRLLSFPKMEAAPGTLSFSQTLTADGKRLKHEAIQFHSPLPIDEVLEATRKWLKEQDRNPDLLKRGEEAFAHHTYQYDDDDVWVFLRDDDHFEKGKILVALMLTAKDANKTEQSNR